MNQFYEGKRHSFITISGQAETAVASLSRRGFDDFLVAADVFEGSKVPIDIFNAETVTLMKGRRQKYFAEMKDVREVAIADSAGDIEILVAGGAGNHSVFLPSWGDTRCVTVSV